MKNEMHSRYFPPSRLMKQLKQMKLEKSVEILGYSVEQRPIYGLKLGKGSFKVLAWSQMHGNETTTTKACLDLVSYLEETSHGKALLEQFQLQLIFQLNPDGSKRYSRFNANKVDLNRDAFQETQPEMTTLKTIFSAFQPDLCLNLHGQRTIFSAGNTDKPASLSFLAPAANEAKEVTPARLIAMQIIAHIVKEQAVNDEWGIGRYDDTFNINCTGDYFTAQGTPTILFEAGHFPNDYERLNTRTLIFNALLSCLNSVLNNEYQYFTAKDYLAIPANGNHLRDIEIQNVTIVNNGEITNSTVFVQFNEVLQQGEIQFIPEYVGYDYNYKGLKVINALKKNQTKPIDIVESSTKITKHLQSFIDF
ncbi:MAG: M14 family zinc carboxypeptidase [Flavobacteriaceae bacterium]